MYGWNLQFLVKRINTSAKLLKDLTETELKKIRDYISENLTVEGELQRRVRTNM